MSERYVIGQIGFTCGQTNERSHWFTVYDQNITDVAAYPRIPGICVSIHNTLEEAQRWIEEKERTE